MPVDQNRYKWLFLSSSLSAWNVHRLSGRDTRAISTCELCTKRVLCGQNVTFKSWQLHSTETTGCNSIHQIHASLLSRRGWPARLAKCGDDLYLILLCPCLNPCPRVSSFSTSLTRTSFYILRRKIIEAYYWKWSNCDVTVEISNCCISASYRPSSFRLSRY